jgi:acetyltransferase-like isoleucine patch superfamily enzyme
MLTEGMLPRAPRAAVYRRRGYRIGRDVEFAPGVVIEGDDVEIGDGTSFGLGAVIRGHRVRIGRRVDVGAMFIFEGRDLEIGDDTVIREQVFVGGPLLPDSLLAVGKRVRIFQMCFLNPSRPLRIGDDTGVGGRSSIFTHGSWQSALDGYPVAFEPVTIGRNVWLPWHVFILPGVEIGDGATIGAGALVNRSIPAGALAAGVPAKVLKTAEDWPRPIEEEEQWQIAVDMVRTFSSFLADNGAQTSLEEGERSVVLGVDTDGRHLRIVLARTPDDASSADVLLQLHGIPARDAAPAWFGLLDKVKSGSTEPMAVEAEQFIWRYGLRFVPIDEVDD